MAEAKMSDANENPIAADLIQRVAPFVPGYELEGTEVMPTGGKPWKTWLEAEYGFRNHWYPTEASRNIADGEHKAIKLLGEDILYLRRNGKLYAIEDRCAHRGSRFSTRPLTYTDDTITCWHHTFTFNLDDGRIRCLLNNPGSTLCGATGIKSYPVREEKGIIFTFVGDITPPPLEEDLPPGMLDEDVALCVADPYLVNANWRLGSEGGFDPGHHFIHNWSTFAINARMPMTFGWVPNVKMLIKTSLYEAREHGPKGFTRLASETDVASVAARIPGRNGSPDKEIMLPIAAGQTEAEVEALSANKYEGTVGGWLPCALKVDPWPYPGVIHNEYYVPRDANSHYYFQCGWLRTSDKERQREWSEGELGQVRWKMPVVDEFTIDDARAREDIAKFYAEESGWDQEQYALFDMELLMWRLFASEHCRGVQKVEHTKGHFKR